MEPQNNLELPISGGNIDNLDRQPVDLFFDSTEKSVSNSYEQKQVGAERFQSVSADDFKHIAQPSFAQPTSRITPTDQPVFTPSKAADNDLIEDEWVKDLIKMIKETKGDPYTRESKFRQMQVDYMKKRYGRIINGGK